MDTNIIDITGLDKAAISKALYDASRPLGMGVFQAKPGDMTIEQARDELAAADRGHGARFDHLHGRVMKITLDGDTLDPRLYDRDNGQGAAVRAIDAIRAQAAE